MRVLFVTNGHGEASIAERIGEELRAIRPAAVVDHFPLVGTGLDGRTLGEVGPRRAMPSGGLVAMGNVRAFARDLRAGFLGLLGKQLRFLRAARSRYDAVVAVGDVYALLLALGTRAPVVFVGTAKSAYVAPYGPVERRIIARARKVFVRDEPTAAQLRAHGVAVAQAPGNVIVDLLRNDAPALPGGDWIALLPGSRAGAYSDAVHLARVVRALGAQVPGVRALLSVAPMLDPERFAAALSADGWAVEARVDPAPFWAEAAGATIAFWTGSLGSLLRASRLALGQAGTANEAAAACGVGVIALDRQLAGGSNWYRMRQGRLLGEALAIVDSDPGRAAGELAALLADPARLSRMRSSGLERMGAPGGARAIALETLSVVGSAA